MKQRLFESRFAGVLRNREYRDAEITAFDGRGLAVKAPRALARSNDPVVRIIEANAGAPITQMEYPERHFRCARR